ncbi:reverse transcriptase [Lasius niger]|uniref:Reverse transcriptase n=1 Tax=Lasius niger TaxID=67767 RepID=A0A0J7KCQ3_LASNI|nr:reverse transcriptase [Lasius niger]
MAGDVEVVEGILVLVGTQIKYLGLYLNGRWKFVEHFRRLAPRVDKAAMALSRLLPNLGGPDGRARRLYAGTVHAMTLYGAPVRVNEMEATRNIKNCMHQVQRRVANRICRGYRTVSWAAVGVLAGVPPMEQLARMYADVYRRIRELQAEGIALADRDRRIMRVHARRSLIERWMDILGDPRMPGQRTVGAFRPCFQQWLVGGVSYKMTQVLTRHGCFGEYLCRIGKERTTRCAHCGHEKDDAQHTLEVCVTWENERRDLVTAVGADLSLPAVIAAAVGSDTGWRALYSFCEVVMLQKEEKEREREQTGERRRSSEQESGEEKSSSGDELPPPGGGDLPAFP